MLDSCTIDPIARPCRTAEKKGRLIGPPSAQYPGLTTGDAYAVQRRWVEIKVSEGNHRRKGHKIGLTPRAMHARPTSPNRITAR